LSRVLRTREASLRAVPIEKIEYTMNNPETIFRIISIVVGNQKGEQQVAPEFIVGAIAHLKHRARSIVTDCISEGRLRPELHILNDLQLEKGVYASMLESPPRSAYDLPNRSC
jgi:hypothetical protein